MKAIRIHGYGGVDVLRYEDVPVPDIEPDEVLVRVAAASVNPVDTKIRAGVPFVVDQAHLRPTFPAILGFDVAGTVERVGAVVGRLKPGDAVFSCAHFGAYAEYVAIKADKVALAPKSIPLAQAAAIPSGGTTSWTGLFDGLKLAAGSSILIEGGSGGVGTFAIQLAKIAGLRVFATSSSANHDLLKALGADRPIDYQKEDVSAVAKDVDGVLDLVGGPACARALAIVREGGSVISVVTRPDQAVAAARRVTAGWVASSTPAARLEEIAGLIDAGKLKVVVGREFPLAETAAAHELIASGRSRGKIVLRVA